MQGEFCGAKLSPILKNHLFWSRYILFLFIYFLLSINTIFFISFSPSHLNLEGLKLIENIMYIKTKIDYF